MLIFILMYALILFYFMRCAVLCVFCADEHTHGECVSDGSTFVLLFKILFYFILL